MFACNLGNPVCLSVASEACFTLGCSLVPYPKQTMLFPCFFSWNSRVQAWADGLVFTGASPAVGSAQLRQEGAGEGEGVSEPESSCSTRDDSMGSSGGFGSVGPGECGVQAGVLLEKDVEQEGLCEDPQIWSGGQAGQLTCPVEVELAHQYGYIPWLQVIPL